MKKTFIGHYLPSDDEFAELWENGRIIVDANVLLATYGVSPSTRETLLRLLAKVKERLWTPNQFALEYQRSRLGKILEQVKHYEDTRKRLKSILDDQFRSRTQHPFVSEAVESGLEEVCKSLAQGKTEQEKLLSSDPYFLMITELFEGRVGAPYSEPDLAKAYEAARKRFSARVPPGFKDTDKPEPERYSDYVAWRQILDFAVKNNVSVILVTDDAKEDWWRKEGAQTFGPRPELVVEYRSCCAGLFYMYSSDRFLELSEKYIGGQIDRSAINELKERRESEPAPEISKATGLGESDPPALKSEGFAAVRSPDATKPANDTLKAVGQETEKVEEN